MTFNIFKYRYYIFIILFSLTWILFLNNLLQLNKQTFIFADSDNYRESASFLYHNLKVHYFRPLFMSIITGIPYLFGSSDSQIYTFSIYINLFCWVGTSMLLFTLLKSFLNDLRSFFYSCVYIMLLGSSIVIFHLLTESVFVFIIMLSYYFIHKYYKTTEFYYLSISLSLFVILILIKPGILYLSVIFLLFYIKVIIKNIYKTSTLFIVFSISMVILQLALMKKQYGNYTISYIDSFTYYNYLSNRATGIKENKANVNYNNVRADYFYKLTFKEQKKIAFEDLKNQFQYNSKNLFKAYIYNLIENTKTPSGSIVICNNIENNDIFVLAKKNTIIISKWQNRILTIFGILLASLFLFKSFKQDPFYAILSFFVLYIFLVSGVSYGEGDRFHIVFFPVVILLFAKFINAKNHSVALRL